VIFPKNGLEKGKMKPITTEFSVRKIVDEHRYLEASGSRQIVGHN